MLVQTCFKPKPKGRGGSPRSYLYPGDSGPILTMAGHLTQEERVGVSELRHTVRSTSMGPGAITSQAWTPTRHSQPQVRGNRHQEPHRGSRADPQRTAGMSIHVASEGQREQFQSLWTGDVLCSSSPLVHGTDYHVLGTSTLFLMPTWVASFSLQPTMS